MEINDNLYDKLKYLGVIDTNVRQYNIDHSDYSKHIIQPWSIWLDYNLNAWDADIVKRILRTKVINNNYIESRITDYKKIIHICKERIRQLENEKYSNDSTYPKINWVCSQTQDDYKTVYKN